MPFALRNTCCFWKIIYHFERTVTYCAGDNVVWKKAFHLFHADYISLDIIHNGGDVVENLGTC